MGREIDSPPSAVFIESQRGACGSPIAAMAARHWKRADQGFPRVSAPPQLAAGTSAHDQSQPTTQGFQCSTNVLQLARPSRFALLHAASHDDETRSDSVAASE